MKNYNIQHFINKFSLIPDFKIIPHRQNDERGNHCALGWCNPSYTQDSTQEEYTALIQFFDELCQDHSENLSGWIVANINNGIDLRYQQESPKQRILAALYDIKAKLGPSSELKVKTIIKYVAISETVREMQPILN